jgi:hypothetical protein
MKSLPHDPLQSDWPGQELGIEEVGGDTEEGDGGGARGGAGDVTVAPQTSNPSQKSLPFLFSPRVTFSNTFSASDSVI